MNSTRSRSRIHHDNCRRKEREKKKKRKHVLDTKNKKKKVYIFFILRIKRKRKWYTYFLLTKFSLVFAIVLNNIFQFVVDLDDGKAQKIIERSNTNTNRLHE
jgi:hypothetical protein